MDQGGRSGEADRKALLTGGQPEPESDMGLAGAAVAESDHVLPPLDVLAARQLQHQQLVERRDRGEVEAVQALHGRKTGLADAPLDRAPLALEQLQLGQAQEVAGMVDTLGGALPSLLVVLAQKGWQLQRLEVMREQDLRHRAHEAAPPSSPM